MDIESYIFNITNRYKNKLFINQFTFELSYKDTKDFIFEIDCCYPYLNAKITYSDEAIKMFNDSKNLTPYILHELCHLLTDPLYYKANRRYVSENEILNERERLTEIICNIVLGIENE